MTISTERPRTTANVQFRETVSPLRRCSSPSFPELRTALPEDCRSCRKRCSPGPCPAVRRSPSHCSRRVVPTPHAGDRKGAGPLGCLRRSLPRCFLRRGEHLQEVTAWAAARGDRPLPVYAGESPGAVVQVQKELGRERSGSLVEEVLAALAVAARDAGARRFVVAGGKLRARCIRPRIAPGVP